MKKLLTVLTCIAVACISLFTVACAPFTLEDTCGKLLEKGYEIEANYVKNDESEDYGIDLELKGGAYFIEAEKNTALSSRYIYVIVFDQLSDATKVWDEYKGDFKDLIGDDGVVKKHGKMLVIATESAYEDFIS